MKNLKTNVSLLAAVILVGLLLCSCQSQSKPGTEVKAAPSTQPGGATAGFAFFGTPPKKTGVQLWSDNCGRCHNIRPPEEFSAQQWDVIVHHMRLRANLTGAEAREIVKFLQASN